ncbi:PIN domain-containing protein [Candidatus Woesearchaeota archaeon]|nr:PIN domain-containing protein [Candidatus Woesearchaeota archaeon]
MIADTSFLVPFFSQDHEMHKKSLEKMQINAEKIIIIDRVLEEMFTVLCYRKGVDFALNIIEKIKNNKDIEIYYFNESELQLIINLANKIKKKISFVDYCILYMCLKNGEKFLCFDKELMGLLKRNYDFN